MSIVRINSLGITDGTIVNGDINASAAIDSTKLTGINDAKAWVNFNGTGTVAIRASFNVTSITDNGTGNYTINFTTAMPDINYSVVGCTSGGLTSTAYYGLSLFSPTTNFTAVSSLTVDSVRVITKATSAADGDVVTISIFR